MNSSLVFMREDPISIFVGGYQMVPTHAFHGCVSCLEARSFLSWRTLDILVYSPLSRNNSSTWGVSIDSFSLIELCRPASLELSSLSKAVFSTPDGSCLISLEETRDGISFLRAYHWNSFGITTGGIPLDLPGPNWDHCTVTSMGSRSNVYLAVVSSSKNVIQSVRLSITNKISEYMFRPRGHDSSKSGVSSRHNCLLDCHADVWTRYPVVAAISRMSPIAERSPQSIRFITNNPDSRYHAHFRQMIHSFERSTQKPTNGLLEEILVTAETYEVFMSAMGFDCCSTYPFGKWLVELLCLIPIHLAITGGNRFIPLKDGVVSSEFERSLLGADVMQIANR